MKRVPLASLLRSVLAAAAVAPMVAWGVTACSSDSDTAPPAGNDASTDGALADGGCGPSDASVPEPPPCTFYVPIPCGYDGGVMSQAECRTTCASDEVSFCNETLVENRKYIGCTTCAVGRRPQDFAAAAMDGASSTLGAYFASVTQLEAASVGAFRTLRRELVAHRAPKPLTRLAERSARDEIRHTRTTRALTRAVTKGEARGVSPKVSRSRRTEVRTLEAIAIENAIEGCVRETFGALVANWQATHAKDRRIAETMERIAADETRHAELAWSVARWVRGRVDKPTRARIDLAMRDAIARLSCELAEHPHPILVERAGIPTAREAANLLRAMHERVWS